MTPPVREAEPADLDQLVVLESALFAEVAGFFDTQVNLDWLCNGLIVEARSISRYRPL